MEQKSKIQNLKSKILVVGAGPAGASLAIRLAANGFDVTLVERERFPRQKLCGEFISPECLAHFAALGVLDRLLEAGGERVTETVFYAPGGRSVAVPSAWFGDAAGALGLSRAEMDYRLLERARESGVRVLEETSVAGLLRQDGAVAGVRAKDKTGAHFEIAADFTVDATGRAGVLSKLAARDFQFQIPDSRFQIPKTENRKPKTENRKLVGFKAHLENVRLERHRCEIYFFRGGYGGLNFVEGDRANHCFLVRADLVKRYVGRTNSLVEEVIFANPRAREAMREARLVFDYMAVAVDGFGLRRLAPAPRLVSVGDAAAFIDPFTGSGMLMALESAEILSRVMSAEGAPALVAERYRAAHAARFARRLRVCALMRRAAFWPRLAGGVIAALGLSRPVRERLARATRGRAARPGDRV